MRPIYFTVPLATLALLALANVAFAIPTPADPSALPTALATAAPAAAFNVTATLAATLAWGSWVMGHWQALGELLALVVAGYHAVRAHQWNQLVSIAGRVTYNLATLTNYDDAAKRRAAISKLYEAAGPLARALFSEAQFALAVETGWKLVAKPQVEAATT